MLITIVNGDSVKTIMLIETSVRQANYGRGGGGLKEKLNITKINYRFDAKIQSSIEISMPLKLKN